MTILKKAVTRETQVAQFERGRARQIVATLEAPGMLALRLKGTRTTYRLPLTRCYLWAVQAEVLEQKELRKLARKKRGTP